MLKSIVIPKFAIVDQKTGGDGKQTDPPQTSPTPPAEPPKTPPAPDPNEVKMKQLEMDLEKVKRERDEANAVLVSTLSKQTPEKDPAQKALELIGKYAKE